MKVFCKHVHTHLIFASVDGEIENYKKHGLNILS